MTTVRHHRYRAVPSRVAAVLLVAAVGFFASNAQAKRRHSKSSPKKAAPEALAVLGPVASGLPAELGVRVTTAVESYVHGTLKVAVVPAMKLGAVSADELKGLADCAEKKCSEAKAAGKKLSANRLLLVVLGGTADNLELGVTAFDGTTGEVLGRGMRVVRSAAEIDDAARDLAHFALKHEARDGMGYIRLACTSDGAAIALDNQAAGSCPAPAVRVKAGDHDVRVEKAGFTPFAARIHVEAGAVSEVEVRLTAIVLEPPKPPVVESKATEAPKAATRMSVGRRVGLATTIVGGAALAGGLALGIMRYMHQTHIQNTVQSPTALSNELKTAHSETIGANVLYGVGGGLSAVGVTLMVAF